MSVRKAHIALASFLIASFFLCATWQKCGAQSYSSAYVALCSAKWCSPEDFSAELFEQPRLVLTKLVTEEAASNGKIYLTIERDSLTMARSSTSRKADVDIINGASPSARYAIVYDATDRVLTILVPRGKGKKPKRLHYVLVLPSPSSNQIAMERTKLKFQ
jgi:hypothetical protein